MPESRPIPTKPALLYTKQPRRMVRSPQESDLYNLLSPNSHRTIDEEISRKSRSPSHTPLDEDDPKKSDSPSHNSNSGSDNSPSTTSCSSHLSPCVPNKHRRRNTI